MAAGSFLLTVRYTNGSANLTFPASWQDAVNQIQALPLSQGWDATLQICDPSPTPVATPIVLVAPPLLGALSGKTLRLVGQAPGTRRATLLVPPSSALPIFDCRGVALELSNLDFTGLGAQAGGELIVARGTSASVRSCTFLGSGPSRALGVILATSQASGNIGTPCTLRFEGSLAEGLRTAIRLEGDVSAVASDSAFVGCQTAILSSFVPARHPSADALLEVRNCAFEECTVGIDYRQHGPHSTSSRVIDSRFLNCRLGTRAQVYGQEHRLEIARCDFSAPNRWRRTREGPIPRHGRNAPSVGVELVHAPQNRNGSAAGALGWVSFNSNVAFMLDVGVDLRKGLGDGRIALDHNTFDRFVRAAIVVRGHRTDWVPESTSQTSGAIPPLVISNNVILGTSLTYENRFPPGVELAGVWPLGQTPLVPTYEHRPPLVLGRNAFVGFLAAVTGTDLASGRGNPVEATGGALPGGRFYSGSFDHTGTPFENPTNLSPGIVQRADFSVGRVVKDYHISRVLKTELVNQSLPRLLPGFAGVLQPLMRNWGYPEVDGVELQNRDHWGNARMRVQEILAGGASLGASERPGYGDFPIVMNNVNETSNILAAQNLSLPWYSYDPPVEEMADAASYYSNMAPFNPADPIEQQVFDAFSVGVRPAPLAALLDEAGMLMLALFPWGGLQGTTGTAPGPLFPGVQFSFPANKADIGADFTEWYLTFAREFLRLINGDPQLHRVVAGFEAIEEARPNFAGFWRETLFQNQLASMLAAEDREHRHLNMYTPNIDGAATMPGIIFPSQYANYPTGALALGLPAGFNGLQTAQSILASLGGLDPIERRLLWDDRGFPVTTAQVVTNQPVVFDSMGRASVEYDPSRPDGTVQAPLQTDQDPLMTSIPLAEPYPAPMLDSTNYRPWSQAAAFNLSWYPVTDQGGHLLPGSQPVPGNYLDITISLDQLAPDGNMYALRDFDRSWAIHLVERVKSGLASAETVAAIHGQSAGRLRAFHALYLTNVPDPFPFTVRHARHDFWAGLHVADALYLHNYGRRSAQGQTPHPSWETYARSFVLFKSVVREYVCVGEPVDLNFAFEGAAPLGYGLASPPSVGRLEGEWIQGARRGPRIGYVPERPVLRASAYRIGDRVIAFITNSFQQESVYSFGPTLPSGETILTVDRLQGDNLPTLAGNRYVGALEGIDAVLLEMVVG